MAQWGYPQVGHTQRSMGGPPAEVLKQAGGNTVFQCPSIFLYSPFLFLPILPNMESPPQKSRFCWKYVILFSHNLHNWNIQAVITTFTFYTSGRCCHQFSKSPVPFSVALKRRVSLVSSSPLPLNSSLSHSDGMLDSPVRQCWTSINSDACGYPPSFVLSRLTPSFLPTAGRRYEAGSWTSLDLQCPPTSSLPTFRCPGG